MNPTRIEIENLGVLHDVALDLPEGLVGILGQVDGASGGVDSNGAGKTTLVNAIVLALFGPDGGGPGRPTFAQDITRGEDRMRLQLGFEHAGSIYRVRRQYSASSRAATLDLERRVVYSADEGTSGYGWEPLTRSSAAETQELLDEILGFTRQTFLASSFLGQEDGCFADGTARQAKQLLTEAAFGRDPSWPRYAAAANEQRRALEAEIERLDGRTEAARELAATKPDVERQHVDAVAAELDHADTLADRERDHLELGQRWQQAREQAARRQAAEAELAAARDQLERLQRLDVAATEAVMAHAVTTEELDQLPLPDVIDDLEAAQAKFAEQKQAYRERQQAAAAVKGERDRAEELLGEATAMYLELDDTQMRLRVQADALRIADDAVCQTCGQHVADEAKERVIAELEGRVAAAAAEWDKMRETVARQTALVAEGDQLLATAERKNVQPPDEQEIYNVTMALASARSATAQRARLEERLVALQVTVDARPTKRQLADALLVGDEKLQALNALGDPVDIAALEQEGLAAKHALDAAKVAFDAARTLRARLEERLAQIKSAEDQIAAAASERIELGRQAAILQLIETGCGVNGVPTLILETAVVPFVETETARVLGELGVPFRVELRTQREKRDGGLAETLDVVIITGSGDEAPYRKLSGGEKMRVSVALRAAVGRLGGVRSGLLVIDEPRWLDQSGVEALLESLNGLRREFPRIYVVTQSGTTLRDSFDEVLTVVKGDDGVSRVVEQDVFEPVAA